MKGQDLQGKRPPSDPITLLAFLGNPGKQYESTRHNAAWMVVDQWQATTGQRWKEKFNGAFVRLGRRVALKPYTFMNRSGLSIQSAASYFSVSPSEILIVHDDLETPFGSVELSFDGGHRGHNGVRSAAETLATPDFWRLRIGVGRPPSGRSVSDWVLTRFSSDEERELPRILDGAAALLDNVLDSPHPTKYTPTS